MNKKKPCEEQARPFPQYKLMWNVLLMIFISFSSLAYDPMAPPGFERGDIDSSSANANKGIKKKANKAAYTLRQIVIHPTNKSAVINGYVVQEGSYLKGAKVEKININTVELTVLGKPKVLTLEAKLPRIRR